MTVEDEEEQVIAGGVGGRPCGCLTLSPSDREVMAALHAQEAEPEELDTTKSGLPQYRAPCSRPQRATLPPVGRRGNSALRKRSVLSGDVEGSGSGM